MNTASVENFASGIINPFGLVFKYSTNDLYVASANGDESSVYQISSNGTVISLTLNGPDTLSNPYGIALDSLGNLYVANYGNNTISKLVPQQNESYSCTNLIITGSDSLNSPYGIAFDSSGNLYVSNYGNDTILKLILQSDGSYSSSYLGLIGPSSLTNPTYLAFDSYANLYVANTFGTNANQISQLVIQQNGSYSCNNLTLTGPISLNTPYGIAFESNTNNLYVANEGNNSISKIVITPGTHNGTISTYINSGLSAPNGIAFNSSNYLYIANTSTNSISATTTPSCFNHDTKILCLNKEFQEEYFPIQDLRKGDIVKTYLHGYRKIDLIGKGTFSNKSDIWNKSMYKMVKTDSNGLFEDLIITGGHGILVDQVTEEQKNAYEPLGFKGYSEKIDDKFIIISAVSDQFIQLTDDDIYTYYHLVPENNGDDNQRFGIWANGILSETPSKNQFLMHQYQDM